MTRALLLLAAGWALLLAAWIGGNPPFAAPDAEAHYLRTLGLAEGRLVGDPAPAPPEGGLPGAVLARRARWVGATTRSLRVQARLAPPGDCYLSDPRRSAACADAAPPVRPETVSGGVSAVSATGTYQPLPYPLPAAAVGLADGPRGADRLARAAVAVPALALLVAAAWVLAAGGGALTLVGLLAAVTPMAIFTAASLTGSGLETAAAIALTAALIAIVRGGAPPSAWALAGTAAAALALSRSTGPAWALLLVVLVPGVLGGARHLRAGRRSALVAAALLVAVALNRWWEAAHGPDVVLSLAGLRSAARGGIDQLRTAAPEWVGGFGYLEFELPAPIVLAWALLAGGLLALGMRGADVAGARARLVAAAVGVAVVLPVLLYVSMVRHTGFGLQGRHVLPVVAALPLLAGELASRRPVPAGAIVAAGALAAAGQLGAWWANARRSAVGIDGPWWFPGAAEWSPPGGWGPWAALAAGGAALLAAATVLLVASTPWRRSPTPSSSAA